MAMLLLIWISKVATELKTFTDMQVCMQKQQKNNKKKQKLLLINDWLYVK